MFTYTCLHTRPLPPLSAQQSSPPPPPTHTHPLFPSTIVRQRQRRRDSDRDRDRHSVRQERGRERERQTDRQRQTDRNRETDTDRQRQADRNRNYTLPSKFISLHFRKQPIHTQIDNEVTATSPPNSTTRHQKVSKAAGRHVKCVTCN